MKVGQHCYKDTHPNPDKYRNLGRKLKAISCFVVVRQSSCSGHSARDPQSAQFLWCLLFFEACFTFDHYTQHIAGKVFKTVQIC